MADTGGLPIEIKQALDSFQRTSQELRQAFDEKSQAGDKLLDEKIGRINAEVAELKTSINASIAALNRSGSGGSDEPTREEKSIIYGALERKAFDDFIRTGRTDTLARDPDAVKFASQIGLEAKDLSSVIAMDGGYATVPDRIAEMVEIYLETSSMRSICRVQNIGSGAAELLVNVKGANALWTSELATRTTTNTPQLKKQRYVAEEIYALPRLTRTILEDAEFDIEGWLNDEVTEAIEIAENLAFVTGDGNGKPRGFTTYTKTAVGSYDATTNYGTHAYRATGVSGAFGASAPGSASGPVAAINGADALVKLVYDFKKPYRPKLTWAMTRMTLGEVRALKDGNGAYIYKDIVTPDSGIVATILGYPVEELEDMDEIAANSFSVALGDFDRGYLIVDRIGVEMLRDDTKYPGSIEFQFRRRTGGDCRDFDAIKFLKFGTS